MNKLVLITLVLLMFFLLTPLYVCAMSHSARYEIEGDITAGGNDKIITKDIKGTIIANTTAEPNLETNPSESIPLEKDDSQKEAANSTASDEAQDISNEQILDSNQLNSMSTFEIIHSLFLFKNNQSTFTLWLSLF